MDNIMAIAVWLMIAWISGTAEVDCKVLQDDQKQFSYLLAEMSMLKGQVNILKLENARVVHNLKDEFTKIIQKLQVENNNLKEDMAGIKIENAKCMEDIMGIKAESGKLMHDVKAIKVENTQLHKSVNALKANQHKCFDAVKAMREGYGKLNEVVQTLTYNVMEGSQISDLRDDIQISDNVSHVAEKFSSLGDSFNGRNLPKDEISSRVQDASFVIHSDTEQMSKFKLSENTQNDYIAFTAYPSQGRNYTSGDKVIFDEVVRNYGGAYKKESSVFICPASAYYLFTVTARGMMGAYMQATIRLGVENTVYAYADGREQHDQGTNSVVLLCDAGEQVAVYCNHDNNGMYAGGSSFTGLLLSLA